MLKIMKIFLLKSKLSRGFNFLKAEERRRKKLAATIVTKS